MSGDKFVLDTNAVLYLLGGKIIPTDVPDGDFYVSVVTELELLSYPKLSIAEEQTVRKFLNEINVVELSLEVKNETISLHKRYSLKLPDSIIAATAILMNASLVTRDKKLIKISSLKTTFL